MISATCSSPWPSITTRVAAGCSVRFRRGVAPATDAIQIRSSVGTYATGAACGRPSDRVVARTAYVHCSMKASISSASSADRSGYESLVAGDGRGDRPSLDREKVLPDAHLGRIGCRAAWGGGVMRRYLFGTGDMTFALCK
jgi:hypothetical protein